MHSNLLVETLYEALSLYTELYLNTGPTKNDKQNTNELLPYVVKIGGIMFARQISREQQREGSLRQSCRFLHHKPSR